MSKDFMKNLIGKVIKVDRGGPESRIGKLLFTGDDYIAVLTEEGVVYYNKYHIKSFTENLNENMKFETDPKDFEFETADNFRELLESFQYKWVRINRGGPETVEGVLAYFEDDFVVLVANKEIIRVALFHIKNVNYEVKKAKSKKNESSDNKSEKKKNESSDNKSKGK